uniref:Cytochrome P450 n=1 Tax=Chenopodium quinoa TaxID=63459 RepID=A0A803N062_CHEQI
MGLFSMAFTGGSFILLGAWESLSSSSQPLQQPPYNEHISIGSRYYSLLRDVEVMFTSMFYTDYVPLFGGFLDKLNGQSSMLERTFKDLNAVIEKIINDHLYKSNLLESAQNDDTVDVLLGLLNDSTFPFNTMNHIKAIMMNLFVGANTISAAVIWALAELIKNPIPMKKVQEEIRSVAQNKGYILEGDLSKLKYFKAVVKETFRLHPLAPILVPRETLQKCNMQGYDILPKTIVIINAWAIQRDPEYWKDPEVFMPERFMESSVELKGHDVMSMIPFGGGRRVCPGYTFSPVSLELVLANLLYSFNWELPDGLSKEEIDSNVLPGIIMHNEKQLCLIAKKSF